MSYADLLKQVSSLHTAKSQRWLKVLFFISEKVTSRDYTSLSVNSTNAAEEWLEALRTEPLLSH